MTKNILFPLITLELLTTCGKNKIDVSSRYCVSTDSTFTGQEFSLGFITREFDSIENYS
jgi:hypothetical protein